MDRGPPCQLAGRKQAPLLADVASVDEVQRRVDLAQPAGGHMQVKRRSLQTRMAHQTLYHRQFDAAFDQMSGKRMTKKVNASLATYTALFDGAAIDVLSGSCADWLGSVAQKEPRNILAPFTMTLHPPVVCQLLE